MAHLRVFPGFIDTHTHVRESGEETAESLGLTHKETMRTGAESALAGGVTVIADMPNTDPPTNTVSRFASKVRKAAELVQSGVPIDIRFYFGITRREHLDEFDALTKRPDLMARLAGIKLFLEHSTGDQKIDPAIVPDVFELAAQRNVLTMAHCEDPDINAAAWAANTRTDVAAHSIVRPPESEAASIAYALKLVRQFRNRFHIAHITTRQGVDLLRDAKAEGLPVTGEVTVHNLLCNEDDYPKLGTRIKMNPPIRSREHQTALAVGVMDGTIDAIITDHAPHTVEEKNNPDPLKAPSGVPGVETRIPLLLSVAAGRWPHPSSPATILKLTHNDIVRLCFANLNTIYGLKKKTPIEGGDAVTVDLDADWTIRGAELKSKCGWTPYEGWQAKGKVIDVKTGS